MIATNGNSWVEMVYNGETVEDSLWREVSHCGKRPLEVGVGRYVFQVFNAKRSLLSSSSSPTFHPICCLSAAVAATSSSWTPTPTPTRRTANYQPTIWADSYIQSLPIEFKEEKYMHRREKLEVEVKCLIGGQYDLVEQLELVDIICQLGLEYHFDSMIKDLLKSIGSSKENINNLIENNNLYGLALLFRLLREHGITNTSSLRADVLITNIKRDGQSFNPNHQSDVEGMLSLYEASYLAIEGEEELYESGKLAKEQLRYIDSYLISPQLAENINYALEIPLRENVNPTLLELAKLDFNMVQSIYKAELQEMSRWWKNLGLVCDELNFARDRLVENYLWAIGIAYQPKFWRCREAITKIICLTTIIDDIYDVYGTLDELKLFTKAIEEWKMDAAHQLPDFMKICFNALLNTLNGIASSFSMEKQLDILPCLKRVLTDLCKAFLVEANWYHNRYTPTLDEYLENAWITIAGICPLIASYCLNDDMTIEDLNSLEFYQPIVRYSCLLLRLYDDLGTTTAEIQRGDVPKSIQCYMNENNVLESVARDHIKCLITNYWKKLNNERAKISRSIESFKKALVDMPRTAQCFYQYEDGYGEPSHETREQITCMIIEPIPL
ncbi:alpha-terpineol synthase, chloroplastic-like [Phalaenopsis equestris]|uniref:alpha-terpineol synthase, chloroplastic-like n=1 Tax=Phalaenopsis equestris TaxID=78828 RepID=UPI0009E45BBA|nr:alpha-terpineol synthase, chloroplastic-like [Phalaenopsis equestris]